MLQQPFTQNNQAQTPSTLSPTTSPQSGSSSDMQGAADQGLLQQEGQSIQVPSSGGATTQQATQLAEESSIIAAQPVFQPLEVIAIFIVVGVLLVATATYVVKKAKPVHLSELSGENDSNQAPVEQEQATESVVTKPPAKKKRQKKQTRRQRRQSAK